MGYPESSEIVWDGQAGCIALFPYHVRLTQAGERAVLFYAAFGAKFQHDIPWAEFQQLWDAFQPFDPLAFADHYEGLFSTGDFSGTLTIAYRWGGQVVSKTIAIAGAAFADDARMQQFYRAFTDFTDAHCRQENQKK